MGLKPTLHFWYALMWVRDAVTSHTFLSWSDNVTAWCSYESYVLSPDLTMWRHDAVVSHSCLFWFDYVTVWCSYESYVLVLIWLCDCMLQFNMSHTCLSWFDYVTWWRSYESYVLVLIWLCDCVMQLWVIRACSDLTMWLRDAVMSDTCLSWFDYVTA